MGRGIAERSFVLCAEKEVPMEKQLKEALLCLLVIWTKRYTSFERGGCGKKKVGTCPRGLADTERVTESGRGEDLRVAKVCKAVDKFCCKLVSTAACSVLRSVRQSMARRRGRREGVDGEAGEID